MLPLTRRAFLGGVGAVAAAAAGRRSTMARTTERLALNQARTRAALDALGRGELRLPDTVPDPSRPPGTDTLPAVEHIVVLMMENHSYDNLFGVLPAERSNGVLDGLPLGAPPTSWNPAGVSATNPDAAGRLQHAFVMPSTCQLAHRPGQEWTASHNAFDGGRNDGFVRTPIAFGSSELVGAVAMGYWDGRALPFTASLAQTFPVADRWFCSLLGQTDPNRRYLIAATSCGMVDDLALSATSLTVGGAEQDALLALPANGTIFDRLSCYGIDWADYNANFPTGATAELYPVDDSGPALSRQKPLTQFFADCRAGSLPGFALVDPDFSRASQENPQDMTVGERFMASVVQAIGDSPVWRKTLLVITYDEHGGYYDHVPPPPALAPDPVPPVVAPGQSAYDGFHRYGFRVPAVVVSPYAVPNGVTHALYDHTSILALVERKWNLPAMTFRDANANDLSGFLDGQALARRRPTFPALPPLAAPGLSDCPVDLAERIPPAGSVTAA